MPHRDVNGTDRRTGDAVQVKAVGIVCPGFPERAGGVTDHTARVKRHWQDDGLVVQVQSSSAEDHETVVKRWCTDGVTAVLLQYVPFLYARRGVSRFPGLVAAAARAEGIRVTLFVHEPWVPPTRLPWLVLSPLQRRQLRRLLRHADAVVTAVPAWQAMLGSETQLHYVGSNLGNLSGPPTGGGTRQAPAVFSPFAAGLRWDWIAAAVDALGAGLTVVGADAEALKSHPATRRWYREDWHCLGRLRDRQALQALATARIGLAPFVDGATGRRTSLLALLSTGIPVVSSIGHLYDPFFGEGPHAVAETSASFVGAARDAWEQAEDAVLRGRRLAWYGAHLDPLALDRRLLDVVRDRPA